MRPMTRADMPSGGSLWGAVWVAAGWKRPLASARDYGEALFDYAGGQAVLGGAAAPQKVSPGRRWRPPETW